MTETISQIVHHYRARQDFQRAEQRLTLQIRAICRRWANAHTEEELTFSQVTTAGQALYKAMMNGRETSTADACYHYCLPFIVARESLTHAKKEQEKHLTKLTESLPIHEWWISCRGRATLGLARLIGEAGRDLSDYPNHRHLWKRLGLAVIDGKSQRKAKGEEGIRQGYNPARRSSVFVVGDSLIKSGGPYKEIYDARKAYEVELTPDMTKIHAHRRAHRYMEKVLVRDLWRQWTGKLATDGQTRAESQKADTRPSLIQEVV